MLITEPIEGYLFNMPVRITEDVILRHVEVDGDLRLVN